MAQSNQYYEHVAEPWFSLIKSGKKTIEGRKNKGRFQEMKIGDIVVWQNGPRKCKTIIVDKRVYSTFEEYLRAERLYRCLPNIKRIKDGVAVYRQFYTEEDEKKYGVLALELELI